jgi:hypothetical protein
MSLSLSECGVSTLNEPREMPGSMEIHRFTLFSSKEQPIIKSHIRKPADNPKYNIFSIGLEIWIFLFLFLLFMDYDNLQSKLAAEKS